MGEPIWCLKMVLASGGELCVRGPRASLQPAFDEFSRGEWNSNTVVEASGICNSPDRAELFTSAKLEHVHAMVLFMEY